MKQKIRLLATLWPIVYLTTCSVAQAQVSAGGAAEPVTLGIAQAADAQMSQTAGTDTPPIAGARVSRVPKPLNIGDTIPETLWQLPLHVINHPEGKDTITLGDYRGKLILLDFWGIGCGSCILALPKLDAVQRRFADQVVVLPTARQSPETLAAFWRKNSYTKSLSLPTLSEQRYLHQYFPHRSISHVVWISPDGRLYSTTHTEAVTEAYVNHALSGHPPHWQPKMDGRQPVIVGQFLEPAVGVDQAGHIRSRSPYYSTLLGYQPAMDQRYTLLPDSALRISRYAVVNHPLYQFIQLALGVTRMDVPPSHVIWQVQDKARYRKPSADADTEGWRQDNYYSYESVMPLTTGLAAFRVQLQQDLRRFFPGLAFRLDTQRITCLHLVKVADLAALQSTGVSSEYRVGPADAVKVMHGRPLSGLVHLLNEHVEGMPVFDATGYAEPVDIELPVADLADRRAVRSALMKLGLDLHEVTRRVVTLTITDQPYTFETN